MKVPRAWASDWPVARACCGGGRPSLQRPPQPGPAFPSVGCETSLWTSNRVRSLPRRLYSLRPRRNLRVMRSSSIALAAASLVATLVPTASAFYLPGESDPSS